VHELSLAQAIWRQVDETMRARPGSRLEAVNIVVGRMSGADPESLQFALELVAERSAWPDARFHVRIEPLGLVCRECGREFETDEFDLACPDCVSLDVDVTGGQDLRIESLEVDASDDRESAS
jgi:hydrogenase nickel incorporation protein HypA/HybF